MNPLIFVVDDEILILENLSNLLEVNEYEVITTNNGTKALELLTTSKRIAEVIISDIIMPEIDGYDLFKAVSNKEILNKIASPTYIYNFLKSLKDEGYIEEIATEKSKRSKGYKLTSSGEIFTDQIFSRFENLIEVAIQSKLKICVSCGVKLYEDFYTETIHSKELNFCCSHCA